MKIFTLILSLMTILCFGQKSPNALVFQKVEASINRSEQGFSSDKSLAGKMNLARRKSVEYCYKDKGHPILSPKIESVKREKYLRKISRLEKLIPDSDMRNDHLRLISGFVANEMHDGTPPDNNLASNNDGVIVSCDNASIRFYELNGEQIDEFNYGDFFDNEDLNGVFFDPKIQFDLIEERFVLTVLHGLGVENHFLIIAVSESSDPEDGWWYYTISTDQIEETAEFDYPSLAIGQEDIYVTSNLFDGNTFLGCPVLQIAKHSLYEGDDQLDYVTWTNISDASGELAFNVIPVKSGAKVNYGPGLYFVSSDPFEAENITLYDLDGNHDNVDSKINVFSIPVSPYQVGGLVPQKDSNKNLNNADCRMLDALYVNNSVHAVFCSDPRFDSGYNGINYTKIDLSEGLIDNLNYNQISKDLDLCYPSIASVTNQDGEESVLVNVLYSSSREYPGIAAIAIDENLEWSNFLVVKEGESTVNFNDNDTQRWGDYTGVVRITDRGEDYYLLVGCYATNNSYTNNLYNAYIAQIGFKSPVDIAEKTVNGFKSLVYPNPVSKSFKYDFSLAQRSKVEISILNSQGVEDIIFTEQLKQGAHYLRFDLAPMKTGVYYLQLKSDGIIKDSHPFVVHDF